MRDRLLNVRSARQGRVTVDVGTEEASIRERGGEEKGRGGAWPQEIQKISSFMLKSRNVQVVEARCF